MNYAGLSNCLTEGSIRPYDKYNLSKYGVGARSAQSLGKRVTYITTMDGYKFWTGILDIDENEKARASVKYVEESTEEEINRFRNELKMSTGTVIIIDKLDRITNLLQRNFNSFLRAAIAATFRNFILKQGKKIFINNILLEPISPIDETADIKYDEVWKAIHPDTKKSYDIDVKIAVVEDGNLDQQGISIARNWRIIQDPKGNASWPLSDKISRHPEFNSVRVEVNFYGDADEELRVTNTKNKIFPQDWFIKAFDDNYFEKISKLKNKSTKVEKISKALQDKLNYLSNFCEKHIGELDILPFENTENMLPISKPGTILPLGTDIKRSYAPRQRRKKLPFVNFSQEGFFTNELFRVKNLGNGSMEIILNTNHIVFPLLEKETLPLHMIIAIAKIMLTEIPKDSVAAVSNELGEVLTILNGGKIIGREAVNYNKLKETGKTVTIAGIPTIPGNATVAELFS